MVIIRSWFVSHLLIFSLLSFLHYFFTHICRCLLLLRVHLYCSSKISVTRSGTQTHLQSSLSIYKLYFFVMQLVCGYLSLLCTSQFILFYLIISAYFTFKIHSPHFNIFKVSDCYEINSMSKTSHENYISLNPGPLKLIYLTQK